MQARRLGVYAPFMALRLRGRVQETRPAAAGAAAALPAAHGIVERANRTVRVECWSQYRDSLACAAMNKTLDRCLDCYNNRRRHRSLGMRTPAEFATVAAMAA